MSDLSAPMKAKRREQGRTLRDLSALIGVSFTTLSRIERGVGDCTYRVRRRVEAWLNDDDQVERVQSVFASADECLRIAGLLVAVAERLKAEEKAD